MYVTTNMWKKKSKSATPPFTCWTVVPLLLQILLCLQNSSASKERCKAWVVQSIPTNMPELRLVPGVLSTGDVLQWLAGNSTNKLDIMAQYWQLVAQPTDPKSGDYGYSKQELNSLGAQQGFDVYTSIKNAADRDVNIRLLQHSGVYPDYTSEPSELSVGRPNVKDMTLLLSKWWGSGIIHAKVWISDRRHFYIGSANNDWKSLTQVKEMGIYITDCPEIAKSLELYYNNLWKLGSLNASEYTRVVWDQQWQVNRTVPCWSHFLPQKSRCRSPLPRYVEVPQVGGYPKLLNPFMFRVPLQTPDATAVVGNKARSLKSKHYPSYLSFSPPELCFGKFQTDEQAWIDTILSVSTNSLLRISTMDWLSQSSYTKQTIYWSSLSSAISEVVFSKNATVRLLVAKWAHFIPSTDTYLKSLLYTNNLCSSSSYNTCSGKVEIKYYEVPGYNSTGPAIASASGAPTGNRFPGYSRVNHGKYAVSDVRGHVGTSNLVWDYFYTTNGVSFGTYNPKIVSTLQRAFDADWNSPYTVPVVPLVEIA